MLVFISSVLAAVFVDASTDPADHTGVKSSNEVTRATNMISSDDTRHPASLQLTVHAFGASLGAALDEARSRGGSSEHTGIRTTPGIGTMMVVTAAVLLVGFFVFRHVMRRPTMRERS